jgi:hypothetical protein
MQIRKVDVTPEMAKSWLERCNNKNRALSRGAVEKYAADMRAGKWMQTHQNAIAFYDDEDLADGQHRLSAVVVANTTIPMFVATGLQRDAVSAIDQGKSRSMADVMKLSGVISDGKYQHLIVAMMNVIRSAETNHYRSASSSEMAIAIERMRDGINFANARLAKSQGAIRNGYVRAAICAAYYFVDHNKLEQFADVLCSGMPQSPADQTVIAVRNRILFSPFSTGSERITHYKVLLRFIKAYDEGKIMTIAKKTSELTYYTGAFDN